MVLGIIQGLWLEASTIEYWLLAGLLGIVLTVTYCLFSGGREMDQLDFDIQKDMLRPRVPSDAASSSHSVSPLMSGENLVKLRTVELLMKLCLTATGCHLPYGITLCYLPSDTCEHTPP